MLDIFIWMCSVCVIVLLFYIYFCSMIVDDGQGESGSNKEY